MQRASTYQIALHGLLIALAVMVFLLARENRSLRQAAIPPTPPKPVVGASLELEATRNLAGQPQPLHFGDSEQESLLLVYTTVCPACEQNQSNWKTLHERGAGRFDIVGLSLSDLESTVRYHETLELPFETVIVDDPRTFAQTNQILEVPTTVHLGKDGRIRESWSGVLSEESLARLLGS